MNKTRGSALAVVLVIVIFAALVSVPLLRASGAGKMMSAREASGAQAYYVAESALWSALSSPDDYADDLFDDGRAEIQGVFDDQGKSYRVVIEALPAKGPNMYLASAYGSTPYSERLAAAEVRLERLSDMTGSASFHFGGMSLLGQQSSVPNFSSTTGNPHLIEHHFRGSDVAVYGGLSLTTGHFSYLGQPYYRHSRESFNIWGTGLSGQFRFLTVYESADPLDAYDFHPVTYPGGQLPWLTGKHGQLPAEATFPDLADHIKRSLLNEVPGGEWVAPAAGTDSTHIFVGQGNIQADYSSLKSNGLPSGTATWAKVLYEGVPGTQVDVAGVGYLWLKPQANQIIIQDLFLLGDLFIIAENCDVLIKYVHADGHRLVVISDRTVDSLLGGSLVLGGSMNEWSPYPPQATVEQYYVGPNSCLWARTNLIIKGSLRPDTAAARADSDGTPIIVWNQASETIETDNVDTWPSIGLVARDGALRFHLFKARGVLIAGGTIEAYRLRLHGLAFVANPYRQGNDDWIGITQCHLSTGEGSQTLSDLLELSDVVVEIITLQR